MQKRKMLHDFGMTFQFGALFGNLPIWENITFRLRQSTKMSKQEARTIAADIVGQLGLRSHVIDQYQQNYRAVCKNELPALSPTSRKSCYLTSQHQD